MEPNATETPKNTFKLLLKKEGTEITLSSDFDSGNMARAEWALNNAIVIVPAQDCSQFGPPSHSKGWFHFTVAGVPLGLKLKFIVRKMSPMATQLKFSDYFRPVFRGPGEDWQRLDQAIVFTKEDDTELHFDFTFNRSTVAFAYCYPFSYEECEAMLRAVAKETKTMKHLYFRDEVATRSPEGRAIHLLTLSSHEDQQGQPMYRRRSYLFREGARAHSFHSKKVVLITARVHPGETPSSHVFNGLLKFLLSGDARAHFLRKNFVFKMIPMLNPDGVYHGHYRMDAFGHNLNRFYLKPDPDRQPSVFLSKALGEYYSGRGELCFYMDLHAHPQKKGNFIYGNAMDTPALQAETQLFPKLLSLNCVQFDYLSSTFSKYHMNAKDRNEELTKEGAGRVVFQAQLKAIYAYTLECGYTSSNYLNPIVAIENSHRKYEKHPVVLDELENLKSGYYANRKTHHLTPRSYENLGKNIGVSLLDLFGLNPASRLPNTQFKSLSGLRQDILDQLNKATSSYKVVRTPATLGSLKGNKLPQNGGRKGHLNRAPSIELNKELNFGKARNRTLAKVNIGLNF